MDHLPYPDPCALPRLEIPYLLGVQYITGDEDDDQSLDVFPYPSFCTFQKHYASDHEESWEHYYDDSEDIPPAAQFHIFFGLLRDVLGAELFTLEDYYCSLPSPASIPSTLSSQSSSSDVNNNNSSIITLTPLHDRLRAAALLDDDKHISELCLQARTLAARMRNLSALANKIYISIDILAWTITTYGTIPITRPPGFSYATPSSEDVLVRRLLDAGWCPHWALIYARELSAPLLHYLAGMELTWGRGGMHSRCGEDACVGFNVGEEYAPRHVDGEEECACGMQSVLSLSSSIGSIIEAGGVPLVRMREDAATGAVELDVVEAGFGRPFIAISHVWSGGLGNLRENAMLECQIRFLYAKVKQRRQMEYGRGFYGIVEPDSEDWNWAERQLDKFLLQGAREHSDGVYIWFDTFCIPVVPANASRAERTRIEEQKKAALNTMAYVYASAMEVLVIDPTLRQISTVDNTRVEIAVACLTCPWMTRCWTFQEGCLARQLSFVLKDQIISPRTAELDDYLWKSTTWRDGIFQEECLAPLNSMPDIMSENSIDEVPSRPQGRLVTVWNHLSERSTTQPQDIHSLLAVMLNLSARDIITLTRLDGISARQRRMLAILIGQDSLPLSMFFHPYSQSAKCVKGYEWVPSFPIGKLSEAYGSIAWNGPRTQLQFTPADAQLTVLIVPTLGSLEKHFELQISDPDADSNLTPYRLLLTVHLLPPFEETRHRQIGKRTCLVLSLSPGQSKRYVGKAGIGGAFVIDANVGSVLKLDFICPLRYSVSKDSSQPRMLGDGRSSQVQGSSTIWAERMSPNIECMLVCDPAVWPRPTLRRQAGKTLQMSPAIPAAILTGTIWSVVVFFGLTNAMALSYHEALMDYSYRRFPRWLRIIFIPVFKLIDMSFRYPRVALTGGAVFTRMMIFALLEYPRMEYIARRIQFERYAESFRYAPPDQLANEVGSSRLRKEWSYQYRPSWMILIPIWNSGINLVWVAPTSRSFLLRYLPPPKLSPQLCALFGTVILVETSVRCLAELGIRSLGLDTTFVLNRKTN